MTTIRPGSPKSERASILIIVLWVAFGLVALALYFAHSMTFELRSSDNRVAALQASHALDGAVRYASNILVNVFEPGALPDPLDYYPEALPIGESRVWFIGRDPEQTYLDEPFFALVDEASRLNLNTATVEMLELLPGMTPEIAAAIVDWRDADSDVTPGGAEDETYQRLNPPYRCKNAPFESPDELRLVYGMDLQLLFGEDTNLNGVLDPNENDGESSPPRLDNRDGRVDPGLIEYVTTYSGEPNLRSDGSTRLDLNSTNRTELAALLEENLGADRANEILLLMGGPPPGGGQGGGPPGGGGGGAAATTYRSLLEFFIRSGLSADEFALIEGDVTVSTNAVNPGLVNVNTAPEAVLACLPGIGIEQAGNLVAARRGNPPDTWSVAWVKDVLDEESALEAGPYLTGRSYQFTADLAAVGPHGRGYQRVRFLLDTSRGTPRIARRQDLTHLGWALGRAVREEYLRARTSGEPPFEGRGLLSTAVSR